MLRVEALNVVPFGSVLLQAEGVPPSSSSCLVFEASDGVPSHDEELFTQGCHVIWSSGGALRARFTAPAPVRQALFCRFADADVEPDAAFLCLLHGDALTIHSPSGAASFSLVPCAFA